MHNWSVQDEHEEKVPLKGEQQPGPSTAIEDREQIADIEEIQWFGFKCFTIFVFFSRQLKDELNHRAPIANKWKWQEGICLGGAGVLAWIRWDQKMWGSLDTHKHTHADLILSGLG